jgi:hypothetical protein
VPECADRTQGVATSYPVQWCLHQEGEGVTAHAWPSFANVAIWDFFQGLAPVPSQEGPPPGGGTERALAGYDTTLSFTLQFPPEMGTPLFGAAVLYPPGTTQPAPGAPVAFLTLNFAAAAVPGDTQSYNVPIRLAGVTTPGDYTLEVVIYVEGGGFPIPVTGVDQVAIVEVSLPDTTTPIVLPGVLPLVPVDTGF